MNDAGEATGTNMPYSSAEPDFAAAATTEVFLALKAQRSTRTSRPMTISAIIGPKTYE